MKKYNLIVPLAGKGQRMIDGGLSLPKPMLVCGNKSILDWSMSSIDYSECNLIFVVRTNHNIYGITDWLRSKYPDCNIFHISGTSGACETVGLATSFIDESDRNLPLIVYCPDTTFEPIYKPCEEDFRDGMILTFKANSPNYSYVKSDADNTIYEVAEKNVISQDASVGIYCFKTTEYFKEKYSEYVDSCKSNNTEAHICPIYNKMITEDGLFIKQKKVEKIHIMGTPDEFRFFENVSFRFMDVRKFVLCSDHSGLEIKRFIAKQLKELNFKFIDVGCYSTQDCDYYEYVKEACRLINNHKYFGIGVCQSGQGINICANKISGIRAGLIQDHYHAIYAIRHNACNFFSISAKDFQSNESYLFDIIKILTTETFDGGRHQNRIIKNGDF